LLQKDQIPHKVDQSPLSGYKQNQERFSPIAKSLCQHNYYIFHSGSTLYLCLRSSDTRHQASGIHTRHQAPDTGLLTPCILHPASVFLHPTPNTGQLASGIRQQASVFRQPKSGIL
jgi:hypothetical protein